MDEEGEREFEQCVADLGLVDLSVLNLVFVLCRGLCFDKLLLQSRSDQRFVPFHSC